MLIKTYVLGGTAGCVVAGRLAENPEVTATIVHYDSHEIIRTASVDSGNIVSHPTQTISSNKAVSSLTIESDSAFFATLQRSLPAETAQRVVFESQSFVTFLGHDLIATDKTTDSHISTTYRETASLERKSEKLLAIMLLCLDQDWVHGALELYIISGENSDSFPTLHGRAILGVPGRAQTPQLYNSSH